MFKDTTASVKLTRRTFLKATALGALLLQGCMAPTPARPTVAPAPAKASPSNQADAPLAITLTASKGSTQILSGAATSTWSYQGEVVQGATSAVQAISGSYLGPILQFRKGQKVRINLRNALEEETIIHWHGLITPPEMDGHPQTAIAPGQNYVYEFEVKNRAGAYWFHPHPHGRTAYQAYMGLAGLILVTDEEERALALPTGAYDVPLVLQDRTFDAQNQLVYPTGQMQGMDPGAMQQVMGFLGDRILVNGRPDVTLPVATRVYRLRLLNGSDSRIYKLAWSNQMPLIVIATDGGLLEKPVQRRYVTLAPGERIELWADFSKLAVGEQVKLQSLAHNGVEAGMVMGGMTMQMPEMAALPNGAPFDVLTVRVERQEKETLTLPTQLAQMERLAAKAATNAAQPRPFVLSMSNGQWLLNGKAFVMEEVDESEKVAFGAFELWEFVNELKTATAAPAAQGQASHQHMGGNMNMSMGGDMADFMAHPMHVHGVQFQVLNRQIDPAYEQGWRTLNEGLVDEGWKDTVLVMPGERVQIGVRFTDYKGRYLVHCHNLEHENQGMMRNYLIV
ncbi:MAG: multicopper oxidase domain-containing protein [Caldilineaceae bacterium]